LSQFTRVTDRRTDGQTDGQTEFSSQYRVCITCSAVKTLANPIVNPNPVLNSDHNPIISKFRFERW